MKYDEYGQCYTTEAELCDMLYQDPKLDLGRFMIEEHQGYNKSVHTLHLQDEFPVLKEYTKLSWSVEEFDQVHQQKWHMPPEYLELDIAQHVLDLCSTEAELQRVGQELLLFQERNLFNLLRYLKYFVDTMRAHNVVWGLGRGSSVASYVLYLLGVHKINSLYYDLPIEEFLK
jgi:DNA polymerase III alpha subunit